MNILLVSRITMEPETVKGKLMLPVWYPTHLLLNKYEKLQRAILYMQSSWKIIFGVWFDFVLHICVNKMQWFRIFLGGCPPYFQFTWVYGEDWANDMFVDVDMQSANGLLQIFYLHPKNYHIIWGMVLTVRKKSFLRPAQNIIWYQK